MGFFDKLKSAFGSHENTSTESSGLEKIRELKRQLDMSEDDEKYEDKEEEEYEEEECEPEEEEEETEEDEDEEDKEEEEEEDDEDEDLTENRAKPIFIIKLRRFNAPLTRESILSHAGELNEYNHGCILMRDKTADPDYAHCFFGRPVGQLMEEAMAELKSWIEDEEEDIRPAVDIVTEAKAYNCDIDDVTFCNVVHYLVNAFGEVAEQVEGNIPYKDSLIRIIEEKDGTEEVHDYLAYPDWTGLDDDEEDHWVERMIAEHGI